MPNYGKLLQCCCCSCICFVVFPMIYTVLVYFLSFFFGDFATTSFGWFSYFFWKFWSFLYFLLKYFILYLLPYIAIITLCVKFHNFIHEKIITLKKKKKEMVLSKNDNNLNFYIGNLKIMRNTLFYIFGFLIALGFLTLFAFKDSLIMDMLTFVNIGILMGQLLVKEEKTHSTRYTEYKEIFAYNCTLIFISAFVIDDAFRLITGNMTII